MGRAMEDMTNSIYRNAKRRPTPTLRNLFLFVTSIARTNLEAEIIQRGGSLCSSNSIRFKPKRDCIGKILKILKLNFGPSRRSTELLFCLTFSFHSSSIASVVSSRACSNRMATVALVGLIMWTT